MKRSEMILAGGLLAVVVGYLVGPSLLDVLTGSGKRLVARKLELKRELAQLNKLNRWKDQSLAKPEGESADRAEEQYRNWVWSLAESVGKFGELNVAPNSRGRSRRTRGFKPIQVQLTGTAKFGDVQRFLYHFYRAKLLHRVVSLRLESKSQDNDPDLEVTLLAEGLSLSYASADLSQRDSLFPQGRFASEPDEGTVVVEQAEEFPSKPEFLVRVGDQYLNVTSNEKAADSENGDKRFQWTYEAVSPEKTLAADSTVELVRVAEAMQTITLDDYKLVNPFAQYDATLIISGSKTITVGGSFKLKARVEGVRPGSAAKFELGRHPAGMSIDEQTGEISWETEKGQPAGKTTLEVLAKLEGREEKVTASPTTLEWRAVATPVVRNEPPTLEALKDEINVIAGSAVEFVASGSDPENGKLVFALASGAPAGATIDSSSGKFRWVPEAPGEFRVTVEVGDDGKPPKKASSSVTIQVSLDSAQFTVLTASVVRDGEPQAWLFDRLKNQRVILRPKSRFRYGNVEAEVVSIKGTEVVFRVGKEERPLVLGESLQKLKPVEKPYDEDPKPSNSGTSTAPSDAKATDAKPSDAKPSDAKPSDAKPSDAKPSDAKPTDGAASDDAKSVKPN
tara:strand:- start:1680 stop:3545 length:1866 start_codon:yes stop_codon:yes gene_type:complete